MSLRTLARQRDRTAERPTWRWLALAVVCLAVLVIVLDNSIMNVALPSIQRTLHANSSDLQWTVDAYTLVFAALLLTAGTLGDRYGRRGTLMTGLAIFGAGSAVAAFAPNAGWLIGFRALMGIGAAAIYPTTLSIITNLFEGPERGRAIGIWAALAGVGVAIGPIIGGLLLDRWWWGSVLLVNVPIVAISLILLPILVPTSRDPQHRRVDLGGAIISTAALTALLYGIIDGPRSGWSSPTVLGGIGLGIVLIVVFLAWERTREEPMLPLDLFSNPRFSAAASALSLTFLALFGYIFLLTQYLQFVRGLSPLAAGLRLASPAAGLIIGAPLAPRVVERVGTKVVVTLGLACAFLAMLAASRPEVLRDDALLFAVLLLFGLGMGMTMAPATDSIMGSVPRDRAGVGSAVNDTTRQTGGALGVAVLGSVAATRYNTAINTLGLPTQLRNVVRQSIGTISQVGQRLPRAEAARLVNSARSGFTNGISVAVPAGAVFVAAAVLIVAMWLPSREQ